MEGTVVEILQPKEEIVQITCQKCANRTNHSVLTNVVEHYENQLHGHLYWHKADHQTIQCRGCGEFAFRIETTDSERQDEDDASFTVRIFPPRLPGLKGIEESELWGLDEKLRAVYKETNVALSSGLPVLAAIGMRAIVETVCKQKAAQGNGLYEKIQSLVEQHVLSPGNATILHHIRTLGNHAAHEVKPHTPEQLALAMDVIDHLIMDVFLLPQRTARLFPRP